MQIQKEILEPVIKNAILAELDKNKDKLFKEIIDKILFKKEGGYGSSTTFLDDILERCLKDLVRELVGEIVFTYKDDLRNKIKESLMKEPNEFLSGLTNGLLASVSEGWRFDVGIKLTPEKLKDSD